MPRSRPASTPAADHHDVLFRLAMQHRQQVVRLWFSESKVLPSLGRSPHSKVAALRERKAGKVSPVLNPAQAAPSEWVSDVIPLMSTHSVRLNTLSATGPQPQWEPLKPRPAPPSPQGVDSRALAATTHEVERSQEIPAHDSVPASAAAPVVAAANTFGVERSRVDGRLSRLTKDAGTDAWLILNSAGSAPVLFAQGNTHVPKSVSGLTVPHPSSTASEGVTTQVKRGVMSSQGTRGWVSGWIPSERRVKARGDQVIIKYYGVDGSEVAPDSLGEKFFVASGIPTGAAVVQVIDSTSATIHTAAGVPVVSQSVTQVDFRKTRPVRVRGNLWNSEAASPEGIAHAEVRVVGFPNEVAITRQDGSFDLGTVEVPEGLAIFIEARLPQGYTHRYSASPASASRGLNLFHFSDARVQRMVAGLEGGVSATSGLVVASTPIEQAIVGSPVVKSLSGETSGTPETYWLEPGDRLVDPATPPEAGRAYVQWLGVEVSSGAVLAGLQSARGRWISAQWMPVSPGVISVLNPAE